MEIHDRLYSFIEDEWDQPAKVLYRMWNDQQKAITYKELKEAIRNGSLTISEYMAWQQDYVNWLNTSYSKTVDKAVQFARDAMNKEYRGILNDPKSPKVESFINEHGGRLIREVSEGQFKAINTLVRQASLTKTMTVDELARSIRPCIGLTERQSAQVKKYYDQLREDGYSKSAALKKQQAFAEKMHRDRAKLIAQTEMAYAANYGMDATVRQSIEDGLISPDVDKEWSACRDERVCPVCGTLHGETVKEDESFSDGSQLPPAHPACRCAVKYHMKPPEPKLNRMEQSGTMGEEMQEDILGFDSNGYHHPLTDEIQECETSDALADMFKHGETSIFSESFREYGLDVQKEVAEGLRWVMRTFGIDDLPPALERTSFKETGTIGAFGKTTHKLFFRPSMTKGQAFPTGVHEMTHFAAWKRGIDAADVVRVATKTVADELEVSTRNRKITNMKQSITGVENEEWKDPHELVAYSVEWRSIGKGNRLAQEIANEFYRRMVK